MKKQNCNLANVTFNTHITPLATFEVASIKGGHDGYGGSLERICRFLQKLVYGN